MEIVESIELLQQRMMSARAAGKTIAFVPTMGFLHAGHCSLLEEGRRRGDLLVLSIFVNPTQFGQGEDFEDYPRDLQKDCTLAQEAGVDLIFAPSAVAMYPHGYATEVNVAGITAGLCGASRPSHFRGVCTVVTKLFNIVQPHVAVFGTKDFQQLAVVKRMTRDLNLPIEIIGMPIYREADGLALSSRNVYLDPEQRQQALALSQGITLAQELVKQGQTDAATVIAAVSCHLGAQSQVRSDYVAICHQSTLEPQQQIDGDSVLLVAALVGRTRLIDNGYLMDLS
ncbi:pantoate--beta-alanine ligase [Pelovirga terrestris]|uniref:Pantothenate synthetase n=1 Tax=Pelovirga terrestris TaxID=2771352 RepID=A0A8J6QWJ2_9BACT|nr:pantoate--beta-alanine ligase [Pelovirga terrestris]MBD1399102.1 pantoate--beta-alanine ligase [Pelovirga terrestris]